MFAVSPAPTAASALEDLAGLARALLEGERDATANAANLSALIFHTLPELNWAGFYWMKGGELVLGPFQGKPACVRIALGKGVCGTAAQQKRTVVVPDVHAFPGHIACDSASNSEVVVPVMKGGRVIGVLDVDSPRLARFGDAEAKALEEVARIFVESSDLD
ncbi:Free methionine-R-sulfoxide reductase [Usitatibacter rugosus]|uniref:Free methionine-R-sulfoxide reductase n=1 Tax=Usitatibacter rugosus TaxID=2732067 RepID=A0A6M4GQV4_9PROT|nr:GAF domain-containing protein [Usitatibacter rugosus]QJR09730.1 Free methionine-R-sulfoxide reductase [Usitatibacter rugosus]